MSRSAEALINSPLLLWARKSANMSLEEAAEKVGVPTDKLQLWEEGSAKPTVRQLQTIANVYKQSFAAFYLDEPPAPFKPPVKDFRLMPSSGEHKISSALFLDFRLAMDRRGMCLDLLDLESEKPEAFKASTKLKDDPEEVGIRIRSVLGVNWAQQQSWRDTRLAFNAWRESIESHDVLVFQSKGIDLQEMRGYSIAEFPLPVIVVNRKDAHAGRAFTLLHEFTHLLLRSSGVCDLYISPSAQLSDTERVEVFCNHVAGATLVPRSHFMANKTVRRHRGTIWEDEELDSLSKEYSVSREVVLRRALTFNLTDKKFYEKKRDELQREYDQREPAEGFVPPYTDVLSVFGKRYAKLVLDRYYAEKITTSDLADILGIKLQHLPKLNQAVGL
jgi:Zn-dependent peptidase ImmA (M78 family)/DNA-binding XRE family transcriptional regulator